MKPTAIGAKYQRSTTFSKIHIFYEIFGKFRKRCGATESKLHPKLFENLQKAFNNEFIFLKQDNREERGGERSNERAIERTTAHTASQAATQRGGTPRTQV